ncbi:SprT family zinc-dependent metalloprotease [Orbus mooreae]|uniref:SprT family zinc-dependent metalloprotease n=1 Tax=Orbus mooreae TaxID=3074107 RepID=UPI00370D6F34
MNNSRVPILLHNKVMSCLRSHLLIANQFFHCTFDEPQIFYRQKGSIAGCALLNKWQIQINLNMLLENSDDFINEVIPHELAHLITYKQFGRVKPHGKEWQSVMTQVFRLDAKRTHSFSLPKPTQQNRYHYHCQCQEHLLTKIRHNKIQHKQIQYCCKRCGEVLKQISSS